MPPVDVADRLRHMLEAIHNIEDDTAGLDLPAYLADRRRRDAVERNLERLSEASRHLPARLRAGHAGIPWRNVADLGNVLRHAYHHVLDRQVWDIVQRDLPSLRAAVEAMLREVERPGG